jgi:S-layer protein
LGGTGGTFGIGRGNLTAVPTANTLALNTNALRGGVITDAEAAAGDDGFTTINLANTGTSVIADLVAADLTTLNISGSGALTLTANTLGGALTTAITSTSTGSVTLGGAALNVGTIYTGGEGVDTITVGATTRAITLGGGDDRVTMSVAVGAGGSVDGGTGTNTLVMAFADAVAASANATFEAGISNFQRLDLGTLAGAVTVNLANLDDINHVTASGSAAAADTTTISGFTSGGTFVQTALLGGGSTVLTGDFAGASDTFNLTFRGTNGFVNAGVLTLDNVETVNITTNDTDAVAPTAVFDANIDATSAVNVSISGNVGMTFANSNLGTAVRNFDASGVTGTGVGSAVTYTTLALTGASTLTGGAGVNTINAAQAVAAVTITGGALADTLTGSATRSSTLNGGGGNDILTGGVAADVINGGEGVDTFQFSSVDIVPNGLPGSGTTEGVVINLSANAISAGDVFTATGRFISGVSLQASVASNTATYLFNNESNTNASVVDTLISIENVIGTNLDDYIVGSDAANVIRGGAGADVLTGGLGNDTFVLQTTAALNGADRITDFMTGTNVIDFAFGDGGLLNNAALRGNGNVYEELATGGALGANTGFVNFTTVVADFNNATVLAAANTLTTGGAAATFGAGDIIYFAVSNNTDSAIFRLVENNAAGSALDAAELLVTLTGVNLAALTGLTAANFADFA